jgi:hypothetical protein
MVQESLDSSVKTPLGGLQKQEEYGHEGNMTLSWSNLEDPDSMVKLLI